MTLAVPLGVRLKTARADRRVTPELLGGCSYRTVAPGGFASATIRLARPLRLQPDEIAQFGRLYIYDTRTGATVWEGRCEDLGRSADENGAVWELAAVGPSAHAHDQSAALFYCDRRFDALTQGAGSWKATEVSNNDETPAGEPGIKLQFPRGVIMNSVAPGPQKSIVYYPEIRGAGLKLAVVHAGTYSGVTSSLFTMKWWVSPAPGTFTNVLNAAMVSGDMGTATRFVGTDWSSGEDQVSFEMTYVAGGSNTVTSDEGWMIVYDVVLQQVRKDAAGSDLLTAASYQSNTVLAHQVVNDLLGRLLPQFGGARVDTTATYAFEQLAYPDGADPAQVLDDLMSTLGTHLWEALETDPDSGKWRFTWRLWPTDIRYEASATLDDYTAPISAGDLYDQVLVRWRQSNGRIRTTLRTQAVRSLQAAGFSRTGFVDLSDNSGTLQDAQQAGDAFLADHQAPANNGTLVVRRPILDRLTGRTVQPWELRPGYLVRIRGAEPELDLLNPARNGSSVCRVVGVDFDDSTCAATLELDAYPVHQAHQIATLAERLRTRRRR